MKRRHRLLWIPAVLALASCALVGRGPGSVCPAAGPERRESDLSVVPVELRSYYQRLQAMVGDVATRELVRVSAGEYQLPVLHVGPIGEGRRRLLVVAGLHGDEVASALAGISIIADVRGHPERYRGVAVHVVAPANPAGLAQQSPYTGGGCDLSRDFDRFYSPEARAIRGVLRSVKPHLVLELRERPEDDLVVLGTRSVDEALLREVVDVAGEAGVPVARRRFLGVPTSRGGWDQDGVFGHVTRSGGLARYAESMGAAALVTQSPGASDDLRMRIAAQLAATRAAARHLGALSRPRDRG